MNFHWTELPPLRRLALSPLRRGFVEGAIDTAGVWLALTLVAAFIPLPSAQLFDSVAEIGATLLVAFAVEVTWLVKVSSRQGADHEEWIGLVTSSGVAGFSGIAVSLALVEHLNAGHGNWLDRVGFAWVVASLMLLGLAVALQPFLTHAWRQASDSD